MENIALLMHGFAIAFSLENMAAAIFGAVAGLIIGAMPGLGGITGVSLLLPLTFGMNPTTAIIALAGLYYSTMYGGAFSAILLNIPGDSPAIVTSLDGYKLTQKGLPGKALNASTVSSFIGGTIGIIILTISGPLLAEAGLAFGAPELALLVLFALTSIGWLLGDDIPAGLLATAIGLMFATIGVDPALGQTRFSFGQINLLSGVSFIPLVVGFFGFSQVIDMIISGEDGAVATKVRIRDCVPTGKEIKMMLPVSIREGIIGTFVGVMPGAGATTSAFLSYIIEKRINKHRDEIGTGSMIGVAAPESSNNAAAAGAFAPLLTLGIPGGATTAVLLGGLMMWGLQPGPLLFTEQPDFVWSLIASMYIGNVICLILAFICIPILVRAISVSKKVLVPIIIAVCVIASYANSNAMFDVVLMLICGILGYLMKLADVPTTPMLLTFVLAPMLEQYVRQSFDMTRGNPSIFFRGGICWFFIVLILLVSFSPLIKNFYLKMKDKKAN